MVCVCVCVCVCIGSSLQEGARHSPRGKLPSAHPALVCVHARIQMYLLSDMTMLPIAIICDTIGSTALVVNLGSHVSINH